MLLDIQSIVAKQLGKNAADVKPDATFATIGADDLDLVEIVMEVEKTFGIAIPDDALVAAAGVANADPSALCAHLTIRTFANVAESSPKQPTRIAQREPAEGDTLRDSQVGTYIDLSQLPNPYGLILVFIPSVEDLTRLSEQRLGRKMDAGEINAIRQHAAVIALPPEKAAEFKLTRRDRETAPKSE